MPQPPKQIELAFPMKGLHETSSITGQPEGTTGLAVNVRGFDSLAQRDRGGQRPGLARQFDALENAPVDAMCQQTQSVVTTPTTLSPALLNRQWVPLLSVPVTVNSTSGAKLITGVNDIAVLVALTVKFTNVGDEVTFQIAPVTNPSGFQVNVQITPILNSLGNTLWIGVLMAGASTPETYSFGLGFLTTNPPVIGVPFTLYCHIRQGGISFSLIKPVGNQSFAGFDQTVFTAPYDWLAAGPQSIEFSSGFILPSASASMTVMQTQHSPGAFPMNIPLLTNPDGAYLTPAGTNALSYYKQTSHGMGDVPIVPVADSGYGPFLATENFTMGSIWQLTVTGAISPTPGSASTHGDMFFNLAENDDTKTTIFGGTGQAVGFEMQRQSNGTWKLAYQTNSTSGTLSPPATFKTGIFTIVLSADGSGNVSAKFNGSVIGTFAGGASLPTGSCNMSLANTTPFRRWTGAAILVTGPSYAITKETVIQAINGNLYLSTDGAPWVIVDPTPIGGGPAYTIGNEISIAAAGGFYWLVDGTANVRSINAATGVIANVSASAGSLPSGAQLITLYRDRLFFTRIKTDPFNYIASASGNYTNFDGSDQSTTGAFAGNDTQFSGLVGETITAMVPFGDASMIMGMSNSIAVMRGDPKAGGSIDYLSRETGIAGPTAQARDADGNLYFLSRDGLYKISGDATNRLDLYGGVASAQPQPMSRGRMDRTLGAINFASTKAILAWDPQEFGLKIFLLNTLATALTQIVFWDKRKDQFWPDQYPPGFGPTAACVLTGQGGADRRVLLGGWDGVLRSVDLRAVDDDGQAISSLVQFTPVQPFGMLAQAKLVSLRFVWGEGGPGGFNATYNVLTGDDAVLAVAAAPSATNTITVGGYQPLDRTRSRGGSIVLQIQNNVAGATWQIESVTATIMPGGRVKT